MNQILKLSRYTTLPVLLDLLRRKKLVLLSPITWDDRNDSAVLAEYQRRRKAKRLVALCFSCGDETIHHWKAYSDGVSGCCIEFDARKLMEAFDSAGLRHGRVRYRKLKHLADEAILVNKMPFTKRWPYRCEEEYRVICEDDSSDAVFELDVDLSCIQKITISQKMPSQVYETIREYLRDASQNPNGRVNRSTLYENKTWINKFKKA